MNLLFPKAALLIVLDIKKSYWVMDVRDYIPAWYQIVYFIAKHLHI